MFKIDLIYVLRCNVGAFIWSPTGMLGINLDFLFHRLALDSSAKPVIQKRRKFGEEKMKRIANKTKKLIETDHIKEIQYPIRLANVMMVKKSSGKWRMCVDFIDLNKAYPKNSYPLPNIDYLVDGASGYQLLNFMDPYFGYN